MDITAGLGALEKEKALGDRKLILGPPAPILIMGLTAAEEEKVGLKDCGSACFARARLASSSAMRSFKDWIPANSCLTRLNMSFCWDTLALKLVMSWLALVN